MLELADKQDLKSCDGNVVRVRFPLPAPFGISTRAWQELKLNDCGDSDKID